MADIKRNILGEGFLPYVKKQIEVRQQVLSPTTLNGSYSKDILLYMTTKAPWVKLTSGVNVSEAKAKELGVPNLAGSLLAKTSILQGGLKYFEEFTQDGSRYDAALTSGVDPTNYDTAYGYTPGLGLPTREKGFLTNKEGNTVYPNDFTAYGRSPVPGITSVDIKPIGQQGTVREATIQIICHNLAQFKIIDALYLRLKYSILLEWGHSIYFDNNKQLVTNPYLDTANNYFISEGNTQDVILRLLENQREVSCGNYDGFLGYVTNFTWSYRKDGGYDITLHARSAGDVIESLKVNANYPGNTTSGPITLTTEEFEAIPEESKNQANVDYAQLVPSTIANKNKSTLNQILFGIKRMLDNFKYTSSDGFASTPRLSNLNTTNIPSITKQFASYNLSQPNFVRKEEDPTKENHILVKQEAYKVKFNNITTSPDESATGGAFYYIKLGTLLRIIESFLLKYDTTRSDVTFGTGNSYAPLFYIDYDYEENVCFTIPRLISSDPKVCLIKPAGLTAPTPPAPGGSDATQIPITVYQVYVDIVPQADSGMMLEDPKYDKLKDLDPLVMPEDDYNIINRGNRLLTTTDPNVSLEPLSNVDVLTPEEVTQLNTQYGEEFDKSELFGLNQDIKLIRRQRYVKTTATPSQIAELEASGGILFSIEPGYRTSFPFLGKFMHFLVNMDFISSTITNHIDKDGNVSIFEFIQSIMDGIQAATGHINDFKVIHNENANILYIQDYNIPPEQMKYVKSLNANKTYSNNSPDSTPTKLNINLVNNTAGEGEAFNGKGSFVTDVQIKTELTNNFATQITVAAQADANQVGAEAVALSRLNTGYIDRIVKKKSSAADKSIEDKATKDAYADALQSRLELISAIDNGSVSDVQINNAKQELVDLYKYDIGQYTKNNNIPGKGFIPVNLNLTMDGISGIKLFESYTINDEILPSNYRNAIKFINRGVTHKIDDKGWVTMLDSLGGPDSRNLTPVQETFEARSSTAAGGKVDTRVSLHPDEVCGKASPNNVNTVYPRSVNWLRGPAPQIIPVTNLPSVKVNLDSYSQVPFQYTYKTYSEVIKIVEKVINQLAPNTSPSGKKLIVTAALTISIGEQGYGEGKIRGFNNNLTGTEKSGFYVFNASDVNGKVWAKEGGTNIYKFFYSFSTPEAGYVPLVREILRRNILAISGPNEFAWRYYRDWGGYGGRAKPDYQNGTRTDCDAISGIERNYNKALSYVDREYFGFGFNYSNIPNTYTP